MSLCLCASTCCIMLAITGTLIELLMHCCFCRNHYSWLSALHLLFLEYMTGCAHHIHERYMCEFKGRTLCLCSRHLIFRLYPVRLKYILNSPVCLWDVRFLTPYLWNKMGFHNRVNRRNVKAVLPSENAIRPHQDKVKLNLI